MRGFLVLNCTKMSPEREGSISYSWFLHFTSIHAKPYFDSVHIDIGWFMGLRDLQHIDDY